ncbi:uncharacterized protein LOC120341032 [Styela clava]
MNFEYLRICLLCVANIAESQFIYPVDLNPLVNPLSLDCFKCDSRDNPACGNIQTTRDNIQSCNGIRIGCWISLDVETGVYERGCIQPASVRQGVFCNRHIDGKEFCYYEGASKNGEIKKCHKCCLHDSCNGGVLKGKPEDSLQTCVRCDGKKEPKCNIDIQTFDEKLSEQCLMPNSDCWKAKTLKKNEVFYTRGCQISKCNNQNVEEQCTVTRNMTICSNCCMGAGKCNVGLLKGSATRVVGFGKWIILISVLLECFMHQQDMW